MDLFVKNIELDSGRIIYHTGVHVALPEDYEMEIRPRSGFTNSELIMQTPLLPLMKDIVGKL